MAEASNCFLAVQELEAQELGGGAGAGGAGGSGTKGLNPLLLDGGVGVKLLSGCSGTGGDGVGDGGAGGGGGGNI